VQLEYSWDSRGDCSDLHICSAEKTAKYRAGLYPCFVQISWSESKGLVCFLTRSSATAAVEALLGGEATEKPCGTLRRYRSQIGGGQRVAFHPMFGSVNRAFERCLMNRSMPLR